MNLHMTVNPTKTNKDRSNILKADILGSNAKKGTSNKNSRENKLTKRKYILDDIF